MCGRYAITMPVEAMVRLFDAVPSNDLPPTPNYNVTPTSPVHAVRTAGEGAGRRLVAMRWGFIPRWYKTPADGPLLINARSETVATKPAFREAALKRRCLVPANGFYEWTAGEGGQRLPWYVRPASDEPIAFAGIWQEWQGEGVEGPIATLAIVTAPAGRALSAIHDREPVIIRPGDHALWLGEAGKGAARLMRPQPDGFWTFYRVSTRVNSSRANGPELIAPIEA